MLETDGERRRGMKEGGQGKRKGRKEQEAAGDELVDVEKFAR